MNTYLNLTGVQNLIKEKALLIILLITSAGIYAQDYEISFTGFGDSTVIDSVLVENLTQETTLTVDGSDILNLVGTLSIDDLNENYVDVKIYPNPIKETGRIVLYSNHADEVEINIFDIIGRLISTYKNEVYPGSNTYEISSYPAGMYIASISTNTWQKSLKFISQGFGQKSPEINLESRNRLKNSEDSQFKSSSNIVQMQYNDGDRLLLQGFGDGNITYSSFVPAESQSVNFEFVECEDADGNNYPVVTIGTQTWMAKNLNVSTASGSWCYDDDPANCDIYGRLYNWNTMMNGEASSNSNPSGVQGLCPQGWHVPSDAEWTQLTDLLGGTLVGGAEMKSTTGWNPPNAGATNSSGFSAIPGGSLQTNGVYFNLGFVSFWWSSTERTDFNDRSWKYWAFFDIENIARSDSAKPNGFSCRCIRD